MRDILALAADYDPSQADDKAAREFDAFSARRREGVEAVGEADSLKALEAELAELPPRITPRSSV